ncbi:AAA family ATPase [Polynucleobacter paneuropaeus]|jgi:KaiC/GvpD/RAD55 family RecA-like ATPase|nr:AAA family ATPase [Polynucleobacter paneuropaeus]MBT8575879.1 AAA family ATPase [Polynucleobacter paneuropaeus]
MSQLEKMLEQKVVFLNSDPFKGLLSMEVTEEIIQNIADAKFAWRQLIPEGHMVVICSKANGGKTTLMVHIAGEMAKAGYRVMYINADASASDIKDYKFHAMEYGYSLINPDLTNGTAEKVVEELKQISLAEGDFSNVVIVLDTLKKFGDMMNKTKSKQFNSLLRTLTAKGITVICLAHTNKHEDKEGKPIFEGTGDLRNDFDELIYLIPVRNPDGTITVSTHKDKTRADIRDESFLITPDREVKRLDHHVNTLAINEYQKNLADDQQVIKFILEHIAPISKTATELRTIAIDKKVGFSRSRIDAVLRRYCAGNSPDPKWTASPASTIGFKYGVIDPEYAEQLRKEWGV